MKKKFLSIILVILLMFSTSIITFGAESDISVIVDGKKISFDVAPRLIGGRTMVPLRAIFEALGATVDWDDSTQTVTAYNEACIVKCTINNNTMYINNEPKTIDVAPMIVDSRTLVPARFVAEGFSCDVKWNPDTKEVKITSSPIDYSQLEKENNLSKTTDEPDREITSSKKGSRTSPYSAKDKATIVYHRWSFEPTREVKIACTNVIRGSKANSLAHSENMFNDSPTSSQEWIFLEFDFTYVSSSSGDDDLLEGSDIIYKDTFFTTSGSAIPVHDTATLGDTYDGYGVFEAELYPGGTSKIVIGFLTDKNIGDILLRIPNKGASTNTWINCTDGNNLKSSYENNTKKSSTNTNVSDVKYYPGTSLPIYTSIVNKPLLEIQGEIYIYEHNIDDFTNYILSLIYNYGWSEYKHETKNGRLTYYMLKNNHLVSVCYAAKYSQVWIIAK